MRNIYYLFLLFIIYCSLLLDNCQCQSGWFVSCSTPPSGMFRDLFFINSQTGWITQDSGKLIKTTDGGVTWTQYNSSTNYHLNAIKFINSQTGWAAGGFVYYYNPYVFNNAVIIKTTNGGINWFTQYLSSDYAPLSCISIINETFLLISGGGQDMTGMGTAGIIKKTYNGGLNWYNDSSISRSVYLSSNSFINSQTGWVSGYWYSDYGSFNKYVYNSTNAGINWYVVYSDSNPFIPNPFSKLIFPDNNTGYLIAGFLKKTTTGGLNWFNIDSINTAGLSDMFFISKDTGWICKNPIKKTNNGGLNWSNQTIPNSTQKLFFINSLTGWAIGNSPRVILKTTTGGITFINQITNHIPDKFSLFQNYPNPFNPVTKIKFDIAPLSRGAGGVLTYLKIYDITGREIQTLVNEKLNPGTYEVTFDGSNFASGVYFYQLRSGDFINTKKFILLK